MLNFLPITYPRALPILLTYFLSGNFSGALPPEGAAEHSVAVSILTLLASELKRKTKMMKPKVSFQDFFLEDNDDVDGADGADPEPETRAAEAHRRLGRAGGDHEEGLRLEERRRHGRRQLRRLQS